MLAFSWTRSADTVLADPDLRERSLFSASSSQILSSSLGSTWSRLARSCSASEARSCKPNERASRRISLSSAMILCSWLRVRNLGRPVSLVKKSSHITGTHFELTLSRDPTNRPFLEPRPGPGECSAQSRPPPQNQNTNPPQFPTASPRGFP